MRHHPQGNTCTVTGLLSNSVGPSNSTASHHTCTRDPAVSPGGGDQLVGARGRRAFRKPGRAPLCSVTCTGVGQLFLQKV